MHSAPTPLLRPLMLLLLLLLRLDVSRCSFRKREFLYSGVTGRSVLRRQLDLEIDRVERIDSTH